MKPSLHEQYLRFSRNELKPEELESFLQQATLPENKEMVNEWMDETWNELAEIPVNEVYETPIIPIGGTRRLSWKRWIAAASVILVLALGSYFLFTDQPAGPNQVVEIEKPGDIKAPETNRAMITLSDGRKIYLDSAGNGTLASQTGTIVIKKAEGQIAYQLANGKISNEVQYNTLTNPRGSKVINMILSDGSQVWLNAGSSVTYPVAFLADERKVNITGEAYFEVTPDKKMPFIVGKGNLQVKVLGTHFNVNAYENEANIKVTLLEGSVKISTTNQLNGSIILKPGQQAKAATSGNLSVVNNVNVEEVMAWKNGLFKMNNTDIATIMRQLERWYNVDVVYENGIPKGTISGEIPRTLNLSQVLKVYEYSGIEFKIEDKKVIVK